MTRTGRYLRAALLAALLATPAHAAEFRLPDLSKALEAMRALNAASAPVSEADEIAMGRELAGRLLGATPLVDDPRAQLYVNRVGSWIAWHSERSGLPWRFGVVETGSHNVYALPGGYVFITRGLYETLEDEAQLAGALARAIATIERNHHVTLMRKHAALAAIAAMAQSVASQRVAQPELVIDFIGQCSELMARSIDRASVLEADARGAALAEEAGYHPSGLIQALHLTEKRSPERLELKCSASTYPARAERLAKLDAVVAPMLASPRATVPLPLERLAPQR